MEKDTFTLKLESLINTYQLSNKKLSEIVGVKPSVFWEKMNEEGKFSPEQQKKLVLFLKKMGKELSKI